ncbi:hypothetical protein ACFWMP_14150 [Paenibacillus sp. NPDC058367]|uniref:hypothetical protein n=1 Tax=Paenibacillus sp. NPDC058367 TaxID=3346460 RepID=UPI00364B4F97
MAIEIQVLKSHRGVRAGKYEARLLPTKKKKFLLFPGSTLAAQIITGAHTGAIIPSMKFIKVSDIPSNARMLAEKNRMLEDLTRLARRINEVEKRNRDLHKLLDSANDAVSALQANLDTANEDRVLLLQQIEQSIDTKVELPLDVAAALNECRAAGLKGISIITNLNVIDQLFRDCGLVVLDSLRVIKRFIEQQDGGQLILTALVNDYTVATLGELNTDVSR